MQYRAHKKEDTDHSLADILHIKGPRYVEGARSRPRVARPYQATTASKQND